MKIRSVLVTPGGFAIYGSCTGAANLFQEIPDPDRES